MSELSSTSSPAWICEALAGGPKSSRHLMASLMRRITELLQKTMENTLEHQRKCSVLVTLTNGMGEGLLSSEVAFVLLALQFWVGILTLLKFFNGIFGTSILRNLGVAKKKYIMFN